MSLLSNEPPVLPGPVLASLSGLCWEAVTRPAHTQESIQEETETGNSTHRGWLPQDTEDTERLPSATQSCQLPFGEFQPGGCVAQIQGTVPVLVFMNDVPYSRAAYCLSLLPPRGAWVAGLCRIKYVVCMRSSVCVCMCVPPISFLSS